METFSNTVHTVKYSSTERAQSEPNDQVVINKFYSRKCSTETSLNYRIIVNHWWPRCSYNIVSSSTVEKSKVESWQHRGKPAELWCWVSVFCWKLCIALMANVRRIASPWQIPTQLRTNRNHTTHRSGTFTVYYSHTRSICDWITDNRIPSWKVECRRIPSSTAIRPECS